jgi:aminoglycoside phosphotransferase (APT) family kinase protein
MLIAEDKLSAAQTDHPEDAVLQRALAALVPRRVLRAALTTADSSAAQPEWQACRTIEALYHPGRYVRVVYALLADPNMPTQRFWPEGDIVYLHHPVRPPVSRRGTVIEIDGCPFEYYRFPNDRRLRGLRKFTGRQAATETWQSWIDSTDAVPRLDVDTLRRVLIRYVPEQKWIARLRARSLTLPDGTRPKTSIAVRSSSPDVISRLTQRHQAFDRFARQGSLRFTVPHVVGTDPSQGLLGVNWLSGDTLPDYLKKDDVDGTMRRICEGLNSLHALPSQGTGEVRAREFAGEMRAAAADLAVGCPNLAAQIRRHAELACDLLASVGDITPAKRATLHADFHWKQLRINAQRIALFDLERVCTGDPLVDVANFATQLHLLGCRAEVDVDQATASAWSRFFLDAWGKTTCEQPDATRMKCHSVLSALRLARGAMRHLRPDWRALVVACVEHTERVLGHGQRDFVQS